jgi:hypothetical protein
MTGIRTTCQECGAPLDARNITGLCRECKLIVRNRRLSSQLTDATDPVSHREAITTVTWFLGGRIVADTNPSPTTEGDPA